MEMRLFDAPLDMYESSMQIKLVRALLDTALNTNFELSGNITGFDYERLSGNPEYANRELERMCRQLGLNPNEYRFFMARATAQARQTLAAPGFMTFEQRAKAKDLKIIKGVWGEATKYQRPSSRAINSETRHWSSVATPEAIEFLERRVEAVLRGEELRENHVPSERTRRALVIGVNCRQVFRF